MRKLIVCACLWAAAAAHAAGQTISPVIVEYREKARGSFAVTNDQFVPMNVVVEARSFSVDSEGQPTFRALDPEIKVEFSATSFRVGPQQTYTVTYRAESARLPAWFSIYATITGPQASNGLKLVIELPHTVYLLTKKALARDAVVMLREPALNAGKQIEAQVENRGAEFSRVREIEVVSSAGKHQFAGFPLFPGQKRQLQLNWEEKGEPQLLVLKFDNFKVESPIRPAAKMPESPGAKPATR
jgi:P pilus assembly chaperone PapD